MQELNVWAALYIETPPSLEKKILHQSWTPLLDFMYVALSQM